MPTPSSPTPKTPRYVRSAQELPLGSAISIIKGDGLCGPRTMGRLNKRSHVAEIERMREHLLANNLSPQLADEWWSLDMMLLASDHAISLFGDIPEELAVALAQDYPQLVPDSNKGILFRNSHYDCVIELPKGGYNLVPTQVTESPIDLPPPPIDSGACLIDAVFRTTGIPRHTLLATLRPLLGPRYQEYTSSPFPLNFEACSQLATAHDLSLTVIHGNGENRYGSGRAFTIYHRHGHFSHLPLNNPPPPTTSPESYQPGNNSHLSLTDKIILLHRSYYNTFSPSPSRANASAKAITSGSLGTFLTRDRSWQNIAKTITDHPAPNMCRRIPTCGRLGIGGSGKSYQLFTLLRDHQQRFPDSEDFTVVVATENLRTHATKSISQPPGKGYRTKTWEKALCEPLNPILVLDDASLMPPTLDLMLMLNPQVSMIVFTGDPAQNSFRPSSRIPDHGKLKNPLQLLKNCACEYLTTSHRTSLGVSASLSIATTSTTEGTIALGRLEHGPIIVTTPGAVETCSNFGREAYTPLTCQGLTFQTNYTIQMDHHLMNSTDHALYTALTRGTKSVYICHSNNKMEPLLRAKSPVCRAMAILAISKNPVPLQSAVRNHIIASTPQQLLDPLRSPGKTPPPLASLLYYPLTGGKLYSHDHPGESIYQRLTNATRSLCDTLLYYTWRPIKITYDSLRMAINLSLVPDLYLHTNDFEYPHMPEEMLLTHKPLPPIINSTAPLLHPSHPYTSSDLINDPELASPIAELIFSNARILGREITYFDMSTQQVDTTDYAHAIFLRHRRMDKATEAWTFKERHVPIRSPPIHYLGGGYALFTAFVSTYGVEFPPYDYNMVMLSEMETLSSLLDKGTTALIKASFKNASDIEVDKVGVFLKGQFISKLGTIYRAAKKGQMITECCQYLNRLFGPGIRYIYNCISNNIGPEILILKNKTDEEVEAWFQEYWRWSPTPTQPTGSLIGPDTAEHLGLNTYEDDYTGFDATQNEDFLCFQVLIMQALHMPNDFIELFIWHHTHLFSFLGEMSVVIPSGAMHTYDFNTLDSMAFFALKHQVTPHQPLSQRSSESTSAIPHHPADEYSTTGETRKRALTTSIALAFSGDDTLANEIIRVHPGFSRLPHKFALQSTGTHTFTPHFVGKLHTPGGSFSDPTILLAKILFQHSKAQLPKCALAYATHCYHLHRNYDKVTSYLNSDEMVHHGMNLRILRQALKTWGLPLSGSFFVKLIAQTYSLL
nr:MAG: replicase [Corparint virus 1]